MSSLDEEEGENLTTRAGERLEEEVVVEDLGL